MRVIVDGEEYINGDDFDEEFRAGGTMAAVWREQGMPYVYNDTENMAGKYLYPVERCHAWFAGGWQE